MLTEFEKGLILGLLIGEGSFSLDHDAAREDLKQRPRAQIIIRMHARSEPVLRLLERLVPGSRLYGPYEDKKNHSLHYQWALRNDALKDFAPILEELGWDKIDPHSFNRYKRAMDTWLSVG